MKITKDNALAILLELTHQAELRMKNGNFDLMNDIVEAMQVEHNARIQLDEVEVTQ